MRPLFCADWRMLLLAVASSAILPLTAAQAQQVKPGAEATDAMGSKVEPMKPKCPPTTEAGEKQKQLPATDTMNKAVPPMNPQDCPAEDAATGTKEPGK